MLAEVEHKFGAESTVYKQEYAMKDMPCDYCMFKDCLFSLWLSGGCGSIFHPGL